MKYTPNDIEFYISWVDDIAYKFKIRNEIGILDIDDLKQSGLEGLVRAWNNLNWEEANAIHDAERQAYIWSYLKKGIKLYIREAIDKHANIIRTPIRMVKDARKEMTGIEKIYVDIFPDFFNMEFDSYSEEIEPYDNVRLYEFLMDLLSKHIINTSHKTILTLSYGIDTMDDRPVSAKNLGKMFNMTEKSVWLTKHRTLKLLQNNEEVQEKIKIYLEN